MHFYFLLAASAKNINSLVCWPILAKQALRKKISSLASLSQRGNGEPSKDEIPTSKGLSLVATHFISKCRSLWNRSQERGI